MAQIDHREGDVVRSQETSLVPFKPNQQSLEFVYPGEGALGSETVAIDFFIEEPLATPFGAFPIALVLWYIRNHAMVEASFARIAGIESRIGVEIRASNG